LTSPKRTIKDGLPTVDDIETELTAVKMKFDRLEQQIDNAEQILTTKGVPLEQCLELLRSDKLRLNNLDSDKKNLQNERMLPRFAPLGFPSLLTTLFALFYFLRLLSAFASSAFSESEGCCAAVC